jgi:predicted transglutaminase-like protease
MVWMITYYRKIPLSEVQHVFDRSISIDFLFKRKLAVCRDYAKLSAAILFNIFREKDVYFVYARQHVSTGIIVENKLYILDKYLPITTFSKWNGKWNKGKFSKKKVERAKGGCMFSVDDPDSILPKTSQSKLDLDKLSSRLEQTLGIPNSRDNSKVNSIEILELKKGAKLYEDDEIVNYSIARRLETIISRERLDKNQIVHIEIKRSKDDLIFLAHLK